MDKLDFPRFYGYKFRFFSAKWTCRSSESRARNELKSVPLLDSPSSNVLLCGRFRSSIFDVKDAPRTDRPIVENIDKITEIIEIHRDVSSRSITQKLKIDHKTVLSHLSKVGFKKKLDVWVPYQLTPKNRMDRISICEALVKRKEINPFHKRMVTGDEKEVTYDNIVRKRLWSKSGEVDQTVA
ncbi:putative DD34D transposase [Trichonephila clavipes]|nr:putative DD34D transposase [Trichonephila clavipes]